MKKRTPPYLLSAVLVIGICIIVTFGVMSVRQNQAPDENAMAQQAPEEVGKSREAPSKEAVAEQIKSRAGGPPAALGAPTTVPGKKGGPPNMPPGMGGATIFVNRPKNEKPRVENATTSSQWYLEESRTE